MMNLKALDLVHLTKLTSHHVDNVTCLECCKYYVAPETAVCGHTLCHTCWRGQRSCPCCAAPLERRSLKLNLPMQTRTEHIHTLVGALENLFDIKYEFVLDIPDTNVRSLNDATKNIKDWLASSQNHFSAPLLNSEPCTQDDLIPVQISSSKIQIHSNSKKRITPDKVVYVQQPQDDWDKIEELPYVDGNSTNKENVAAINKQPLLNCLVEDNEYSSDNPRRSSRKKELNLSEPTSKNLSSETEKKSNKAKQNWNNVKRMRKEFSKLNKQNRNKLNVSIEMCKKTQSTISKPNADLEQPKPPEVESPQPIYTIEDNTPTIKEKSKDKDNALALDTNNVERNHSLENLSSDLHEICNENDVSNKTVPEEVINKSLTSEQSVKLDQDNKHANVPHTKSTEHDLSENKKENVDNKTTKMPFIKKGVLCPRQDEKVSMQAINIDSNNEQITSEDIEISIKIGNTLTKIVIKKKSNDVQLKVNTDQEVQTSNCFINDNIETSGSQNKPEEIQINIANDKTVLATTPQNKSTRINTGPGNTLQKSSSTKKNTASAETVTAPFEITESVEKELSNIMECEEIGNHESIAFDNKLSTSKNCTQKSLINKKDLIQSNNDKNVTLSENKLTNDVDIFDNGSNQEQNLHFLMNSHHAPSEILIPTARSKKFQNHPDKRDREINDEDEFPSPKKLKSMSGKTKSNKIASSGILQQSNKNNVVPDNDSMNYDVVMDQVFASIDADIEESQKALTKKDTNKSLVTQTKCAEDYFESQKKQDRKVTATQIVPSNKKECDNEKYSENLFSIIEKETDSHDNKAVKDDGSTQHYIDNLLTPGMCRNLASTHEDEIPDNLEMGNKDICTPYQDHDDSDKSVVEETPQKEISIAKQKTINEISVHHLQKSNSGASKNAGNTQATKSIINVSDSIVESNKTSKDVTIIDAATNKQALETPLTINRFVDHIKHKSTPVARKSLNFECANIEDDDDPEQTLCPSTVVAKTTQEKEFMCKAFEQTPKSPVKKALITKNIKVTHLKYCIAGSCLSASELNNVKMLCRKYNWKYVDKYTKEVTHLVVGVDDENRSQRSVKYMCALAASKWIVSYEWVETCINTNLVVGENHYEVLDGTGEPGPKRSRLAKNKLFQGITFFCMPPFSVLDADALKEMLEASGGTVVNEAKAVKATGDAPAFLLAEPEHTQEDQFVYLALELGIVPVNYEWVLNCLGSYSLSSIHELLLCPSALLPPQTANWPAILISRDSE